MSSSKRLPKIYQLEGHNNALWMQCSFSCKNLSPESETEMEGFIEEMY